jgi:cysteine desulfurase
MVPTRHIDEPAAYFDAAAAAPLHPAAREALVAAMDDGWADPGKLYGQARRARQLYDAARAVIAEQLGVRPEEVTFCPSGGEACRRAVGGLLRGRGRVGRVVVHSAVEHSAILKAVARADAVPVGVDRLGRVDVASFEQAVRRDGVAAAALMSANHEVGTVQPVAQAAMACQTAGVPLLVDAAQSVGRVPVPDGWSVLTASAHKWGGPPGVGVLAVRTGVRFAPGDGDGYADGGYADGGYADGGYGHGGYGEGDGAALPLLVAAAAALRAVAADAPAQADRLSRLVTRIRETVAATVPDVEVVGDPVDRLPHLVTFSCLYVDGEALLHALDRHGFAVSSGSSCTSDTLRPSHVLEAMGVLSHGNVRVSLHRDTTEEQVDRLLAELPGIVSDLRAQAGVVGL